MKKLFAAAFAMVVVTGCAHVSDVIDAHDKGEGDSKVYDVPESQAWTAAVQVMRWAGADTVEQHPESHYLVAQTGVGAFTYGTLLGAWVEPVDSSHTKVTVVSKRKVKTEAVTSMTEDGFQTDMVKAVALLKDGKPLPSDEP